MEVIKGGAGGGSRKPYQKKTTPVPKFVEDDDAPVVTKRRARSVPEETSEVQLPTRIQVRSTNGMRAICPGTVWRQAPFKWDPQAFGVESERIHDRIIESSTQDQSLLGFLEDPEAPLIYGVSGNPDDAKAKLFAAYLVEAHIQRLGNRARVVWHTLYGQFGNPLLADYEKSDSRDWPTLLVLTNLTAGSTNFKLEKARDLIQRFDDIPRIVVSAGEDPISFHSTRLYTEINALAYFADSMIKRRIEII
jgi:hypothetical protein